MGRGRRRSSPAVARSASCGWSRSVATRVRIVFDDLHDTGIYSWDYLRRLGREQAERWAAYEAELAARGLSRDPPPPRRQR